MRYKNIQEGRFLNRPNRFIAHVEINGREEICHVKNTGRCRELLVPGATVFLEESQNPARKTKYDLVGVKKGDLLINMDSQIPNYAVKEWLEQGDLLGELDSIRQEVKYGNSRFDLYAETGDRKIFIEVKGVTLEEEGIARFPDAPTERGIKHIQELIKCRKDGYEAYLIFVVQMKGVRLMEPNDRTHKAFGDALRAAYKEGVQILAYDCQVTKDSICLDQPVEVRL